MKGIPTIILDTNFFLSEMERFSQKFLLFDARMIESLRERQRALKFRIQIPRGVEIEVIQKIRENHAAFTTKTSSLTSAGEKIGLEFKAKVTSAREYLRSAHQQFEKIKKSLKITVTEFPSSLPSHEDLFYQAASKAIPFDKEGKSYRDAIIHLIAKHSVSNDQGRQFIFVTEDKNFISRMNDDRIPNLKAMTPNELENELDKKLDQKIKGRIKSLQADLFEWTARSQDEIKAFISKKVEFNLFGLGVFVERIDSHDKWNPLEVRFVTLPKYPKPKTELLEFQLLVESPLTIRESPPNAISMYSDIGTPPKITSKIGESINTARSNKVSSLSYFLPLPQKKHVTVLIDGSIYYGKGGLKVELEDAFEANIPVSEN